MSSNPRGAVIAYLRAQDSVRDKVEERVWSQLTDVGRRGEGRQDK